MVCPELEMALIFDHNEDDGSGLVNSSMGMLLVFKSGTPKMKPQLRYGSVFGGGRFYILYVSPEWNSHCDVVNSSMGVEDFMSYASPKWNLIGAQFSC